MRVTHIDVVAGAFKKHHCRFRECDKGAICKISVGDNNGYYCLGHRTTVLIGLLGLSQNHRAVMDWEDNRLMRRVMTEERPKWEKQVAGKEGQHETA